MMNPSKRLAARYLYAVKVKELLKDLGTLDEMADNIESVVDTFSMHFKLAAMMDPAVSSQMEAFKKAKAGIKAVEQVLKGLGEAARLFPDDKTVQRGLKDATAMDKRYRRLSAQAHKMIATASKKNLPPALKKAVAAVTRGIMARLVDPKALEVSPWHTVTSYWGNQGSQKGVEYQVSFTITRTVPNKDAWGDDPKTRKVMFGVGLTEHTASKEGPRVSLIDWTGRYTQPKPYTGPKQAIDMFLSGGKGWKGIKGEESALQKRIPIAKNIASALQRALNSMQSWDMRDATIDKSALQVKGEYRSSLPKEGERSVGEYEYERMVDDEISRFRKVLDPLLKPYMKHIKQVSVRDEEKSWIHTWIDLK